jgi:hypothetical protein
MNSQGFCYSRRAFLAAAGLASSALAAGPQQQASNAPRDRSFKPGRPLRFETADHLKDARL